MPNTPLPPNDLTTKFDELWNSACDKMPIFRDKPYVKTIMESFYWAGIMAGVTSEMHRAEICLVSLAKMSEIAAEAKARRVQSEEETKATATSSPDSSSKSPDSFGV